MQNDTPSKLAATTKPGAPKIPPSPRWRITLRTIAIITVTASLVADTIHLSGAHVHHSLIAMLTLLAAITGTAAAFDWISERSDTEVAGLIRADIADHDQQRGEQIEELARALDNIRDSIAGMDQRVEESRREVYWHGFAACAERMTADAAQNESDGQSRVVLPMPPRVPVPSQRVNGSK